MKVSKNILANFEKRCTGDDGAQQGSATWLQACVSVSVSFLAELSVRSRRKLVVFII